MQLGVRLRHHRRHLREVLRRPHARDDVLALRVDEEVARRRRPARHLVAREGHARARRRPLVAEDHLLHVAGGPPVVGDVVDPPVGRRPLAQPRVEHRADRRPQLHRRVLRERLARGVGVDRLERVDERAQVRLPQLHVELHARLALARRDRLLEALAGDAAADVAVHLHEPPVGVPREARVARPRGEALHRGVGQPEVEDRVHHPRHRLARARAHGDQQRVLRVAEPLAGALLQHAQRVGELLGEPVRLDPVGAHVGHARLRRDGEAGRHAVRAEHARHLRDVRALAAEELAHVAAALLERHDPVRHGTSIARPRTRPPSRSAIASLIASSG